MALDETETSFSPFSAAIFRNINSAIGRVNNINEIITVNRNTIPGETRSPFQTSGLRIGTAALTSRGMGLKEMDLIADLMHQTLLAAKPEGSDEIRKAIEVLCGKFPLPY